MHIKCPHCHNPIHVVDERPNEVVCPDCGGSFRVHDAPLPITEEQIRRLGKFEVMERVGIGGFGTVYRARDTELDRIVALKVAHPTLLESQHDRERFFREARAAAQLRHPGIVTVHDVIELDSMPTIISDFIDGVTLRDLLQVRRLTFRESAELIAQVADSLDYAHSLKIVHRDIKPANIMVEWPKGQDLRVSIECPKPKSIPDSIIPRPLLVDFGLALRDEAEVTLTVDGQIIGTPAYMSPEQAAGQSHKVDRRSDVYNLGVVLYELLTGEIPFRGSKVMMVHQVLREEPRPPRRINDKIPRDLETITLKAMAKDRARRYGSARELSDDLRRYLGGSPIHARPVSSAERLWRWMKRNPRVAGLTGAVASLVLLVVVAAPLIALRQAALRARAEQNFQFARAAVDQMLTRVADERLVNVPLVTEVQKELLRDALQFYQRFLDQKRNDPQVRTEIARIHVRIADVNRELGEREESKANYRQSIEMFERLAAEFPGDSRCRQDLGHAYNNLGVLLAATDPQVSQANYNKALKIRQDLASDYPEELRYQNELAAIYNNLGVLQRARRRFSNAAELFSQASLIQMNLAKQARGNEAFDCARAGTHINLAACLCELGKLVEAEMEFREAVRIQTELVKEFPRSYRCQTSLARGLNDFGLFLAQSGRSDEAEAFYEKALSYLTQLVASLPSMPEHRHHLAKIHINLGKLFAESALDSKTSDADPVRAQFQKAQQEWQLAVGELESLIAEFPVISEYQKDLELVLDNLAKLKLHTGEHQ